jgi:hypothetical protein
MVGVFTADTLGCLVCAALAGVALMLEVARASRKGVDIRGYTANAAGARVASAKALAINADATFFFSPPFVLSKKRTTDHLFQRGSQVRY